jgi:hypothetical protein
MNDPINSFNRLIESTITRYVLNKCELQLIAVGLELLPNVLGFTLITNGRSNMETTVEELFQDSST